MKFAFLMDPLETVIREKDTTFRLMLGAQQKGHQAFYLPKNGLSLLNGALQTHLVPVKAQDVEGQLFIQEPPVVLPSTELSCVFIRTDPPFNYEYLVHTWLLDHLADKTLVVNHPAGIRTVNEKIWACRFTGITPPSLVSRRRDDLKAFLTEHQDVIAKPTDGFGGQSVFHIHAQDKNANVILETLSLGYTRDIIAQKYIPQAAQGDKRILLLNGEPLGAVLRMHSEDDHRNNFFSGGKPRPADITKRDRDIIATLAPHLRELGLYFVGIDILGDYLIEVNVTSPTCLQEMNVIYQKKLEHKIIDFIENMVEQNKMQVKM